MRVDVGQSCFFCYFVQVCLDNHLKLLYFKMYDQAYNLMTQYYGPVINWPNPYNYSVWYDQLSQNYQQMWMNSANYSIFHEEAIKSHFITSKPKLSRNQKRKQKKNAMQSELESQKKSIGKWVYLERKDLVNGLEKIEEKQNKLKQKKKNKLSHLIQIHKEVYKVYKKKGQIQNQQKNRRVNLKKKKKRSSFIKRMKDQFANKKNQNREQKLIEVKQVQEEVWQQCSDSDHEEKSTIKIIQYDEIGKLTGKQYHGFLLREWCQNVPSQQLEDITLKLINRLAYKQAIRKAQKPEKAKRLIVSGVKQCKKTLTTIIDKKKAQFLIVGLNIERNNLQKGIDDEVLKTIKLAKEKKLPIINISTRSKLGRAFTGKFGPRVTMISIINSQGYQDMVDEMLQRWKEGVEKYQQI